jgi:hypothetical protein
MPNDSHGFPCYRALVCLNDSSSGLAVAMSAVRILLLSRSHVVLTAKPPTTNQGGSQLLHAPVVESSLPTESQVETTPPEGHISPPDAQLHQSPQIMDSHANTLAEGHMSLDKMPDSQPNTAAKGDMSLGPQPPQITIPQSSAPAEERISSDPPLHLMLEMTTPHPSASAEGHISPDLQPHLTAPTTIPQPSISEGHVSSPDIQLHLTSLITTPQPTTSAGGHISSPGIQPHQILNPQPNGNGITPPSDGLCPLREPLQPNNNGITTPQTPSPNPPQFSWPSFQPQTLNKNPFSLQPRHTNDGPVPEKRPQDPSLTAQHFKRRRIHDAAVIPSNVHEILSMLETRDRRNREALLDELRLFMGQRSVDKNSTTTHWPRSTPDPTLPGAVASDPAASATAVTLTEEKILNLIMPLLSRGMPRIHTFLLMFDLHTDPSQSSQSSQPFEDVEMGAPLANAAEVAAAIFAEIQKHTANGKHRQPTIRHDIQFYLVNQLP